MLGDGLTEQYLVCLNKHRVNEVFTCAAGGSYHIRSREDMNIDVHSSELFKKTSNEFIRIFFTLVGICLSIRRPIICYAKSALNILNH